MSVPGSEPEEERQRGALLEVVRAAQCVAGALAARQRGDRTGASDLLASGGDARALAEGAMLLSEVALGLYREQTGESMDACVRDLSLRMEAVARTLGHPNGPEGEGGAYGDPS